MRSHNSRILLLICGAVSPLGCVNRQVAGTTTIYATESWAIAVIAIAALMGGVLGWYVRRRRKLLGYALLCGGVLVLCTTVPSLYSSRTIIDPDHVEWNSWFKHYSFRFDELEGIEHTIKNISFGGTIRGVHYLEFTKKSGDKTYIQVDPGGDRFLEDAIPEMLKRRGSEASRAPRRGRSRSEAYSRFLFVVENS